MIRRLFAILLKEFLSIWNDKKSRMVLLLPPLTQLCIFTWAATLDVKNVPIAVLNRDHGEQGFELVQRFYGSRLFSKVFTLDSVSQIPVYLDEQRALMVVFIDETFSRDLDAGQTASVQILLDGRRSNTTQILFGYASTILTTFQKEVAAKKGVQLQKTELVPRNWFNPNLLYHWYNVPCLFGVITMLVSVILTALSIARERELGTFDQLLISPAQPIEILIGKSLPAIGIGMLEGTLIFLVGVFLFGVPFTGSLFGLYVSMFVFVCSVVGVGLFLSSLCQTQQQAILGSFIFITPAIMLSGFATPIENMPKWLQYVTYANPLRYFLVITKGSFLKALPLHIVFRNVWQMALIAVVTLSFATWFFRKKIQ